MRARRSELEFGGNAKLDVGSLALSQGIHNIVVASYGELHVVTDLEVRLVLPHQLLTPKERCVVAHCTNLEFTAISQEKWLSKHTSIVLGGIVLNFHRVRSPVILEPGAHTQELGLVTSQIIVSICTDHGQHSVSGSEGEVLVHADLPSSVVLAVEHHVLSVIKSVRKLVIGSEFKLNKIKNVIKDFIFISNNESAS